MKKLSIFVLITFMSFGIFVIFDLLSEGIYNIESFKKHIFISLLISFGVVFITPIIGEKIDQKFKN